MLLFNNSFTIPRNPTCVWNKRDNKVQLKGHQHKKLFCQHPIAP